MSNQQITNHGNHKKASAMDESVISLIEQNTVTDEKSKVIIGGHTYTSITRQKGDYTIYTVKKDGVLFCISMYKDVLEDGVYKTVRHY